ncbi:MAG: lysophospholipid acyltransferase family protein [Acidobacteria bacterium]|nr:lysophospholipid acyltransferase family protein [Acidobacteriota bacterium]
MENPPVGKTLLGFLLFLVISLWRISLRLRVHGDEIREPAIRAGRPILHLLWHQRLVLGILAYPFRGAVTMASRSKDGDIIAAFLKFWGFRVARGSSSRGGREALSEMIELVAGTASWCALTTDGPRGPARKSKPGFLTLARATNALMVPVGSSAVRGRFLNSWDRFFVPLPFSRCVLVHGPALAQNPGEPDEEFLNRVDAAIDAATAEADRLCGVTGAPRERAPRAGSASLEVRS